MELRNTFVLIGGENGLKKIFEYDPFTKAFFDTNQEMVTYRKSFVALGVYKKELQC